jgi:hypothetical protein
MYMNLFTVRVSKNHLPDVTAMFNATIKTSSQSIDGFQGMIGLIDDETGDVLSVALNDTERGALLARESPANKHQIERYTRYFVSPPERDLYRLEVRYTPHNRPFPGHEAHYARATTGWVKPANVASTLARSRDSLIYAAILERGCAGFLLGSIKEEGKILGISMWQSLEHMLLSEGDEGYYQREMASFQDVLLRPTIRRTYRVFDRAFAL